ncbi:MAG: CoB--CoM heterodisulfide reductase iron-sulfur subunit B family protein [Candidatus Bathyarchaeota archaeon]
MTEYSYFPGCSAKGIHRDYDDAARLVSKKLGINLVELEDWNCCGATSYMSVHELHAHLLSARNLALAGKAGRELVTVCNACLTTLNKTNSYLAANPSFKDKINKTLALAGLQYDFVKVRHLLDVIINDVGKESVKSKVVSKLDGLKVAPYYGCQIRGPQGNFDDPDFPEDHLFSWLGAKVVPFPFKAMCCGGMLMVTNEDIGLKLVKNLLECALANDAECIVTACPLCQTNIEAYQGRINKKFKTKLFIPIISFTQLMRVAFGLSAREHGLGLVLGKGLGSADKVLSKYMKG